MGWLEGVLTGYAKRHYEIEDQKRKEAGDAAEREGRVFETLLNSPYKDIQQYAMAGMLDLSNPKRRKGGVAGWMGEVETTPYLDMIRRTQTRLDEDPNYAKANLRESYYPWLGQGAGEAPGSAEPEQGGTPPATPSVPTPAGQVAPAAGTPPGALPSTSAVTGGPVTPPTPAPPAPPASEAPPSLNFSDYLRPGGATPPPGAPPAPPALAAGPAGGPAAAAAPSGGPPTPQAGAAVAAPAGAQAGPPVPPGGAAPPVAAGPPAPASTPGMVAPGMPSTPPPAPPASTAAFGTPIPRRTQLPGIFPTTADTQQAQARATVQGKIEGYTEMYRAQNYPEAEAYAKAAKLFEQDLLNTGSGGGLGQTYAAGPITPDPTSPTGYSQAYVYRMDPTRQIRIPSQAPSGRNTLIASYQKQWNAIQAPVRAMELNLRNMVASYKAYTYDHDRTAWEPLRLAFLHVVEPNSVVMPTEFARQVGVLSLKESLVGYLEKLQKGGAPMEQNEVDQVMRAALAMWQGVSTFGAQQRAAIEAAIDRPDLQIPHEAVFGSDDRYNPDIDAGTPGSTTAAPGTTTPGTTATPAPGAAGATPMYRWDAAQNKYVLVK